MSIETNCPACGAPVVVKENQTYGRCAYCSNNYRLDCSQQPCRLELVDGWVDMQEEPPAPPVLVETSFLPESAQPVTGKAAQKREIKKAYVIPIIVGLLLCCIIGGITRAVQFAGGSTKVGGVAQVAPATSTPTVTPTPFFITLPLEVRSREGWALTIERYEVRSTLNGKSPENDYFIVFLLKAQNHTPDSDCLMMDEFILSNGYDDVKMTYDGLNAAKASYKRDFPGGILGQCMGKAAVENSVLAFDVAKSSLEWTLRFQDKQVRVGLLDTLLNPPPTATPLPPTVTPTPTVTATPLPAGKVNQPQGNFVNVRSGPGTEYAIAFQLTGDSPFSLLGRNADSSWYFIQTASGEKGWLFRDLAQVETDPAGLPESAEVVPTLTPVPTATSSPVPTLPYSQAAPKGSWCAQNSDRGVCVSNIEYRTYIGYTAARADARFIVMGAGVKNISRSEIHVNPHHFTIVMENGATYDIASETFYFDNALSAVNVLPGNFAQGGLAFYVPNTTGPAKIIYSGGGLFEDNIVIDLRGKPSD